MPNYKTTNTKTAADMTVALENADHRPPYMNLTGSEDWRDNQATCAPRWRKSIGKLFRRDALSSIEAMPQENSRPTQPNPNYRSMTKHQNPHTLPSLKRPIEEAETSDLAKVVGDGVSPPRSISWEIYFLGGKYSILHYMGICYECILNFEQNKACDCSLL
jgi:hypothetical protein